MMLADSAYFSVLIQSLGVNGLPWEAASATIVGEVQQATYGVLERNSDGGRSVRHCGCNETRIKVVGMLKVQVRLQAREDGSATGLLVNRDELIASVQQELAREVHRKKAPPAKPYDPAESHYDRDTIGVGASSSEFEHLKSEFSSEERSRLRSVSKVPREFMIPAAAVVHGLIEDVIKTELTRLFPVCRQVGIQVEIEP